MQTNIPQLFIEINNSNYIFTAVAYDEDQKIKIIEKIIASNNDGVNENKFTDIKKVQEDIKKNIQTLENKLDYFFKEVTIVLDIFNHSCINFSGFKKLNGSQVLKENISYILNSLKLAVSENEKEKTILHIFNSKSTLDGTKFENLPIGLYGDFYNHELTFFLIGNNDLKNIKQVFNNNSLVIKKILIKNFIEGAHIINENSEIETFFKIKISKKKSQISYFDQASFKYVEYFDFGTNIVLKDIAKVCSINEETIENILSNEIFKNNDFNEKEVLEEIFFSKINYRKIRKQLILDIANARIQEITNIILNENINVRSLKKENIKVYLTIEDKHILNNFGESFKSYFFKKYKAELDLINNFETDSITVCAANLSIYGWKKEAIPTSEIKNSVITKIFKFLFG